MRIRVSLLVILFVSTFQVFSQNISKYYTSLSQQNGTLYFIYPLEGFGDKDCDFKYDLTYLTSNDSLTLNFSITAKQVIEVDSIRLINGSVAMTVPTTRMFVEPKKSKWHARYTSKVLFRTIDSFFQPGKPLILLFIHGEPRALSISSGSWEKHADVVHRIFQLIQYNK